MPIQRSPTATVPISPASRWRRAVPVASAAGETERMMPPPGARHWLPTWTETRLKRSSGTSRKRRSVSESSSAEPSGQMRAPWPVRPSAKVPSSEKTTIPLLTAPLLKVMRPFAVSSTSFRRKTSRKLCPKDSSERNASPMRVAVLAAIRRSSRIASYCIRSCLIILSIPIISFLKIS